MVKTPGAELSLLNLARASLPKSLVHGEAFRIYVINKNENSLTATHT